MVIDLRCMAHQAHPVRAPWQASSNDSAPFVHFCFLLRGHCWLAQMSSRHQNNCWCATLIENCNRWRRLAANSKLSLLLLPDYPLLRQWDKQPPDEKGKCSRLWHVSNLCHCVRPIHQSIHRWGWCVNGHWPMDCVVHLSHARHALRQDTSNWWTLQASLQLANPWLIGSTKATWLTATGWLNTPYSRPCGSLSFISLRFCYS